PLPDESFDLVVSRMVCEHIADPAAFHGNVLKLLAPGGTAVHFFATLYSPPLVVNWLAPDWLTRPVLHWLQPHRRDDGVNGKFPAYYRWCVGPLGFQLRRFERLGYVVDDYTGYFGHSGSATLGPGYYDVVPPLRALHESFTAFLLRHPHPLLTTYAVVVLRKPSEAGEETSPQATPARRATPVVCGSAV
ncbi:MAG: class I SAM-dependent methyltransferase, partial [Planctomycetia bacterium]